VPALPLHLPTGYAVTPAERDRLRRDVEATRCPDCNALKLTVLVMPKQGGAAGTVICGGKGCGYNAPLHLRRPA
jgi:hypothetical protein